MSGYFRTGPLVARDPVRRERNRVSAALKAEGLCGNPHCLNSWDSTANHGYVYCDECRTDKARLDEWLRGPA